MRLFPLVLLFAFPLASFAQSQTPELKERTAESEAQKHQSERRVTLDIQVTDSSGKPVEGLEAKDFHLLDHGDPQPLTSFREFTATRAQNPASQPSSPPVEAVLLVDVMNSQMEDVGLMRQGIEDFLNHDGGHLPLPVSIIFLTDTGIRVTKPSTDGVGLAKDFHKLPTPVRVLQQVQGVSGAMDRFQRSLNDVQLICQFEAARPGRKLLLWMGPGWPLLAGFRTDAPNAANARRFYSSIVATTTFLRRAHITLYNVNPLNLHHDEGQSTFLYEEYLKGISNPGQADSPYLAEQVLATHSGGLVLNKSGDIPSQIRRCLADADSYYEITFDAAPGSDLGEYRPIEIHIDHPGVTVRTNSAYYAGPPQNTGVPGASPDTAAAPSPSADTPVIHVQTHLVLLDVTALDKQGKPVPGLTAADFHLREDKSPQTVGKVEEHIASSPPPDAASAPTPAPSADGQIVATNKPPPGAVWNVLAVDLLNTPKEARSGLQEQLAQFARQLPPQTPVALVAMRGNIQVLSSFADGPSGLSRALKKGLGPLEVGAPSNIVEREEVAEDVHSDPATLQNKGNIDTQRQAERAQTTLNSFSTIAQWLKPYPGRKNIFWLSAGFPLEGQPFGLLGYDSLHPAGPGDQVGERSPMQQKTDKELQSARIAIYPIDSAGVAISDIAGETSADTKGNFRSANPLVNATKDNARKAAQHSEMLELAAATGGVARFDNDIAAELQGAIHQAESYYTLSYTPHDTKWDGTYHRIHLESDKPGIQLIYRQGYYARDAVSEPPPSDAQFLGALQPGQPSASSLVFTATLSPSATEVDISYAIDASSLQFARNPDGKLQADLDCAILEFNAQGKVLEKALTRLAAATTPDQLAQFTSKPLEARQTIALKPGAAILVLGVQDRTTGRFGTLQLSLPER